MRVKNCQVKTENLEAKSCSWPSSRGPGWPVDGARDDLLKAFEAMVGRAPDRPALYLKDPRTKRGEAWRYLALSYSDLRCERDAWAKRLRGLGVGPEDRVLLWLPCGLAMVAASHALLRMGVEVGLAEESLALSAEEVQEQFAPTWVIVSSAVAKRTRRALADRCEVLEIESPLMRLAPGVKSSQLPSERCPSLRSDLVAFRRDTAGRARAVRFGPTQLAAMIASYRSYLGMGSADTEVVRDALSSVLWPSLGVCEVFAEAGFGLDRKTDFGDLPAVVEDLGVNRMRGTVAEWDRFLAACEAGAKTLPQVGIVFVDTDGRLDAAWIERLHRVLPAAEIWSLFGLYFAPVVAVRRWLGDGDSCDRERLGVGCLLPGLAAEVETTDACPGGNVGALRLSGPLCGSVEVESLETGYMAERSEEGELLLCGRSDDVVKVPFGVFLPARCEAVFLRHENVVETRLIALKSKAGPRPAMVVAVKPGALPKDELAESKFKAELLQLGAGAEDTKLILDFFFVERIPKLSREALARRYGILARIKALF